MAQQQRMKRAHPDEPENVYPTRRAPFHNTGMGGPMGFERLREGMGHHSSLAGPHMAPVPGQPPSTQPANVGPIHGHPVSQTVHVQQPFPSHNQNGGAAPVGGQQHFQRLKVEDALSYLDQVKLQFGNQPQVYNEFLDIMKEFKSQTIDTPGVISRVSSLFKGHPDLIVGFNTFLPPGYKIEVNMGEGISVTMQAGPGQTQQTHQIVPPGPVSTQQTITHSVPSSQPPSFSPPQPTQPAQPTQPSAAQTPPAAPQPTPGPPSLASPGGTQSQTQAQHHAISYVTKIKNRFQGQPEVYQRFLDILNNYQTEQKAIKESAAEGYGRQLTDHEVYIREGDLANEVYHQVAKLFQNQEDLLQEFSQFLPDSGSAQSAYAQAHAAAQAAAKPDFNATSKKAQAPVVKQKPAVKKSGTPIASPTVTVKTEPMEVDTKEQGDKLSKVAVTQKRQKSALKDVTLAEAVKHGSFSEFAFFDKVRKALKCQEVYENFLRCLVLFNNEVISRPELIQLASSFLGKSPELFTWFKTFLGYKENQMMDPVSGYKDRGTGSELAHLEINYASCKRNGASYRALPKSYTQPKCSGRTSLCKEVLNDTWVSLPSWSEDTQFPGTRKTQYEEYIYKCEDERFELDVVIETNLSAIKVLEAVLKKLNRMSPEEQQKYRLDNTLGGSSEVIYKKAIYRIYGDKAPEIIDGLKKTPHVAVPLVLKRLKAKDEEWREAQKQFNKIWREQNEKYYLKSLDHQGINFKQTDTRMMRSKSLIHEIEQIFEERTDQAEEGQVEATGPHLQFVYQDKSILDDAASLIVHHMKRQSNIHKDDKVNIKQSLCQVIPDFFFAPRGDLSDDEDKDGAGKCSALSRAPETDDIYNLFFCNNNWYVFFRLHELLCDRLLKMFQLAMSIAENEAQDMKHRKEGTAVALRLKQPDSIDAEEYYPAFLDMVKNLLDGNMDAIGFEDTCRELFGVNSYIVFTIDKLIQNIVRQLQHLVTDEVCNQLTELYRQETAQLAAGGATATATLRFSAEAAYQKKVESMLSEENCFKVVFLKEKATCRVSIELLATDDDQSEDPVELERWSEYVDKFIGSSDIPTEVKEHMLKKPIFLLRNARFLQSHSPTSELGLGLVKPKVEENEEKGSSTDEAESNGFESPRHKVALASDPVFNSIVSEDNLVFKLSVNSYKMVYVAGTGGYMYRRKSLLRALKSHPKINEKLHQNFVKWHSQWLSDNVSREQARTTDDWLMGKQEVLKSTTTLRNTFKQSGLICNLYSIRYTPKDIVPK